MSLLAAPAAAVALILLAASAARACEGGTILFADDLSVADTGWGGSGDAVEVGGGRITIEAAPSSHNFRFNPSFAFDEADICSEATPISGGWTGEAAIGLMFWVKDNQNFYVAQVTAAGDVTVFRLAGGAWQPPLSTSKLDKPPELGKPIKIRIVTRERSANIFVGGVAAGTVKGSSPSGGGNVGFYVQTGPSGGAVTAAFDAIKITR